MLNKIFKTQNPLIIDCSKTPHMMDFHVVLNSKDLIAVECKNYTSAISSE